MALVAWGIAFPNVAHARLKTYRDLTEAQMVALQQSQHRLAIDDAYLLGLDHALARHRISRRDYDYRSRDALIMIGAEAKYQNDIMTDSPEMLSEEQREILQNMVHYGIVLPAEIIGYIVATAARSTSGGSFSP